MRMTKNKRLILDALAATDDYSISECGGLPPRSAANAARVAGLPDVANVARTLRNMEADGLVTSEVIEVETWCEVPRPGHYMRKLKCYWPVARLEEVKAGIALYEADLAERVKAAEDKMAAMMSAPRVMPDYMLPSDDNIRMDAEGRTSLDDLHRATGGAPEHAPFVWIKSDTARGLIAALEDEGSQPVSITSDGAFIARELVLAYAADVSPAFQLQMIQSLAAR